MNEKAVVGEVEGAEVVDLGDAAKETRVFHPTQMVLDNQLQWGRSFFE